MTSSPVLVPLRQAVTYARAAVDADNKGEFAVAIGHYKEAVVILESEIPSSPEEQKQSLYDKSISYQARIDVLEQILGSQQVEAGKEGLDFVEETRAGAVLDAPPAFSILKPFWLMRVWAKTMVYGGYLTPQIFVPKNLWYRGGKFTALQTKISSCEAILEALTKLKESGEGKNGLPVTTKGRDALLSELESFSAQMDAVQNSLHFHLSFIAEVKKEEKEKTGWGARMKKIGDSLAKGAARLTSTQSEDEGSDYILLLKSVFEQAQFLEEWIVYFSNKSGSTNIVIKLKQISDFFYDVVCQFVIRDFNSLVEKYLKKQLENFV